MHFIEWKRTGGLLWTGPLAGVVLAISVCLVGAAVLFAWVVPVTRGGSYEDMTITFAMLGLLGGAIATASRIDALLYLKYQDVPLPEIRSSGAAASPVVGARRVAFRRYSGGAHCFLMGIAGFIAAGILWLYVHHGFPRTDLLPPVIFGTIFLLGLLIGPGARFVITNEFLIVDTGFRREQIPRSSIESLESTATQLKLRLRQGHSRRIRVDSPLSDIRTSGRRENYRTQVRTARRLARGFAEVAQAQPRTDAITSGWRTGPIAVAILLVLADVAVLVPGLIGRR